MAHVAGFEYDIFISYNHEDNHAPSGTLGWVDQFHEYLESWLVHRRPFKNLKIWRDKELHGNTEFNLSIQNKLQKSALLFALNSRQYLQSEYCAKERAWFYQSNSSRPGKLYVGEYLRIFNILLNNIHHSKWPEEFRNSAGFPIHDAENADELGEFTSPRNERFERQLREIVDAVEATLNEFTLGDDREKELEEETKTVRFFLSDVADTQQSQRNRLIAEIQQQKGFVFDDTPPPFDQAAHDEKVKEILSKTDIAVHLFDKFPGRKIFDSKEVTYSCRQAEIAMESPVPQIIWVPNDIDADDIEDDKQHEFLTGLEYDAREKKDYEFIRSPFPRLIDLISQKITEWRQQPQLSINGHSFLIDTHQVDQSWAYKLAGILSENGLDVDFNKESRDPSISLTYFENTISQVQNLIIMFGKVKQTWLVARIKKAVKLVAEKFYEDTPLRLENIWIYMLPESKGKVDLPRLPGVINITFIDNSHSEKIDPQVLNPLFQPEGGS